MCMQVPALEDCLGGRPQTNESQEQVMCHGRLWRGYNPQDTILTPRMDWGHCFLLGVLSFLCLSSP